MKDFTHKGWLWFCPVYLNANQHEDGRVEPRHWSLYVFFMLAFVLEFVRIFISSCLIRDYEPEFMFLVTGELHNR